MTKFTQIVLCNYLLNGILSEKKKKKSFRGGVV